MEVEGPAKHEVAFGSQKVLVEGEQPFVLKGPLTLILENGSVIITPQEKQVGSRAVDQSLASVMHVQEAVREASLPLDILPQELWLTIMRYLKGSGRDLINLGGTSTWFRSLVQLEYPGILLAEILPLLAKWIGARGLMNLKLTCRSTSQMVENVLESIHCCSSAGDSGNNFFSLTPPHFRGPCGTGGGLEWPLFNSLKLRFGFPRNFGVILRSLDKLEKLKMDLELKRVSRVPGKYVKITQPRPQPGDPEVDFLDRVLLPLARMTDAITALEGEFEFPRNTHIGTYDLVARILSALPSLRCLVIEFRLPSFFRNEVELFRQHVQGHPFPAAPSLESFSINGFCLQMEFFEEIVSRYGRHLKSLGFGPISDPQILRRRSPKVARNYQLPELRELQLMLNWNMLSLLRRMNAPNLQWFSFKVSLSVVRRDPVDLTLLSGSVHHFRSLSTLQIEFPMLPTTPVTFRAGISGLRNTRHENMRHLKFIGWHLNAPMMAFATMFPNLSSVEIKIHNSNNLGIERKGTILEDPDLQLISRDRAHESKLWTTLPKLEIIIFEDRGSIRDDGRGRQSHQKVVCTRKQVNEYQKRRKSQIFKCPPNLCQCIVL